MATLTRPTGQRGAAALIVTMMLFFAMVLVALFVNRNLVFEQRSSANQYRATQAFEAAEAGLEWAQAQLNANQRIGSDCLPGDDAAAPSFRGRLLILDTLSGKLAPVTWLDSGVPTPLQPTCVRVVGGWSCACPVDGPPVLAVSSGLAPAPAFTLQFIATGRPGLVQVASTGCSRLAGPCQPGTNTGGPEAIARVEVLLGRVAGLRTPPAAALTTRGAFDAGAAAIGVHNPDPATGLAIHAGGPIQAANAQLSGPAGSSLATALASNDGSLASLSADQFFASYFGVARSAWKRQPAVTRLAGGGDLSADVVAAVATTADAALLWIDGDMTLTGPLTLGSADRPVLIVVDGQATLVGAVALHGMVYSHAMAWNSTGGGAFLRGAAIAETGYSGDGAPALHYDTQVLARLTGDSGSFVRVGGSWRDF